MNTMQWLYLLINFLTVIIPFLFSFHGKLRFNKYFRQFFLANIIVAVLFIIWDIMFTARGVWGFNPLYVTGISIFNLPIEEVLFFICIPFACVFTYHSLSLFWKIKWSPAAENTVVSILAAGLLLTGLFNYDKLYTVVTFIGTALALVAIRYYFKVT